MFLSDDTSREDLLTAVYGDLDLIDAFIKANKDPEFMGTADVLAFVREWVEAGDECAAA